MTVDQVIDRTDWKLLAAQKQLLLSRIWDTPEDDEPLWGLVNWIDAIQDAAEESGTPGVFPPYQTTRRKAK